MTTKRLARACAFALAVVACSFYRPPAAHASVALAVSLDELALRSVIVGLVTVVDQTSVWEDVENGVAAASPRPSRHEGARILTYSRVRLDETLAGKTTAASLWIRTRGGVVGKLGQSVEGEATFRVGDSSLLFLQEVRGAAPGVYAVTARAQGQFALEGSADARVAVPAYAGSLAQRASADSRLEPATRVLGRSLLLDLRGEISSSWRRTHAP